MFRARDRPMVPLMLRVQNSWSTVVKRCVDVTENLRRERCAKIEAILELLDCIPRNEVNRSTCVSPRDAYIPILYSSQQPKHNTAATGSGAPESGHVANTFESGERLFID